MNIIFIIFTAFVLDLIIGDPRWFPYPVKLMGRVVKRIQHMLPMNKFGGVLLSVFIISYFYMITSFILKLPYKANSYLGFILSCFFIFSCISIKSLYQGGKAIYVLLLKNDLVSARKRLSLIVGRDTENLNKEEIINAAIETKTISENTADAIIAPLFFAFIGGFISLTGAASLAVAYKGVNTLDSMIGYKNEKYINFGWALAKIDDIVNYIPARITGLLMSAACFICGRSFLAAMKSVVKYGKNHPSPNAGIPESAAAGILGLKLGGPNYYLGQLVEKPYIGEAKKSPEPKDIMLISKIMVVTAVLMLVIGSILIIL